MKEEVNSTTNLMFQAWVSKKGKLTDYITKIEKGIKSKNWKSLNTELDRLKKNIEDMQKEL